MENTQGGIKELYDVSIRLNQPLTIGDRQYSINESILSFEKVEIAQLNEEKRRHYATGGYNNNLLIDWEVNSQATFKISNGILSPASYALLSNSKLNKKSIKSVSYKEEIDIVEYDKQWIGKLKFYPNNMNEQYGIQGNPDNEPMPMGRKSWLPLKPLPPKQDRFIFCYDAESGQRILNFCVHKDQIIFYAEHRRVIVDYTFDYRNSVVEIDAGNRLFGGFLNLSGKMTVKDYITGKPKTAILEIPRLKIQSAINMRLGMAYSEAVVGDFQFVGYPQESRQANNQSVFKLSILNTDVTGEYIN